MLMGAVEQLHQMRLQPIPSSVFTIDAIVAFLQCQEVVMHITQVIKHIADAHILRMVPYLVFIRSHSVTSYQSLTPNEWIGRHVTLRLRSLCLPTGIKKYNIFDAFGEEKREADFPPQPKGWGLQSEDLDECGSTEKVIEKLIAIGEKKLNDQQSQIR